MLSQVDGLPLEKWSKEPQTGGPTNSVGPFGMMIYQKEYSKAGLMENRGKVLKTGKIIVKTCLTMGSGKRSLLQKRKKI